METFELWNNDSDVSVANIESFTTWFKYINLTALIQEEKDNKIRENIKPSLLVERKISKIFKSGEE